MRHTKINRILCAVCAAATVAAAAGCGHSDTAAPAVTPQIAPAPTQQVLQMENATEAAAEKAHENMLPAKTSP